MTALCALLLVIAFIAACFLFLNSIAKAKCWSYINRNVLLQRAGVYWRAIGP